MQHPPDSNRSDEVVASARATLAADPQNGERHLQLGMLLLRTDGVQEAEPHLRRAAELLADNLAAQINFAACLLGLNRTKDAVAVYDRAAKLAGSDIAISLRIGAML